MFLKTDDELLFLTTDDEGEIEVSEDADFLFRVLSSEGMLQEVADEVVVAELERLRDEIVEAKLVENDDRDRDRDRAEYERLKLKFEGK